MAHPQPEPAHPPSASRTVARHRGLFARTLLVSLLTLVSRLLGFVREALMAAVFGDRSVISDAFITAWRFPNLFRRLLGEGALSVSLQSEMTKRDIERGDAGGRALFRATFRVMIGVLLAVTVAAMVVTWWLPDQAPLVGGAWLGPKPEAVRDLTVRVMPYVVLVCAAALCGGALAVRGHFALPNLAPTAMNLVWIGTLVWIGVASGWGRELGTDDPAVAARQWELARWLAWGLLAGGVVQLLLHLPPLGKHGLLGPTPGETADPWRVLRTTAPLVVGAAIYQINVMVDGLMANGLLRAGGSSAIYYANRVQQFPLALVSTAAVNAVFPLLNAHGHLGERGRVRALHDRTQLGILFLALPAAAGLLALALPIASVCYERGNFGLDGTERVAVALRCLAFALVPAG
ncbi:MAG TPA: lipid II flippase MurJ, partial [Planctomycetota bacterium]